MKKPRIGGQRNNNNSKNQKSTEDRNKFIKENPQKEYPVRVYSQYNKDSSFIEDKNLLEKYPDCEASLIEGRDWKERIHSADNLNVRFLIPECIVGEIIGKKGANVKEAEKLSGVSISLSKRPEFDSPERIQHVLENELLAHVGRGTTKLRTHSEPER